MCPGVCITEQKHVFKENAFISSIIFFYTKSSRIFHVSDNIPFNLTVSVLLLQTEHEAEEADEQP